jgi:hypothetical protein
VGALARELLCEGRPMTTSTFRIAAVAAVLTVTSSPPVFASLGGNVATVQSDRVQMQGALRQIVQRDAFTTHEMQSAAGVVVREFVSPDGTVFGIAWQGGTFPDLRQLLGPYFARYQQEAERAVRARRGHGPLTVDLGDVVVQTSGHMRGFTGRAYLPGMVPQGVAVEGIK